MFQFSSYARNGPGVNKNLLFKNLIVVVVIICLRKRAGCFTLIIIVLLMLFLCAFACLFSNASFSCAI